MKLPITTSHTSYVEFETPCYYKSKWGNHLYKIYETGILIVHTDQICNFYIEVNDKVNQYAVDKIRDLLETGIPVAKQEFDEQWTIAMNHLNIVAQ